MSTHHNIIVSAVLRSTTHSVSLLYFRGFCKKPGEDTVVPVIFDPATYYGDREVGDKVIGEK